MIEIGGQIIIGGQVVIGNVPLEVAYLITETDNFFISETGENFVEEQ